MCVCVWVCVCVCVCVCACTSTQVCVCVHVCLFVCKSYKCTCTYMILDCCDVANYLLLIVQTVPVHYYLLSFPVPMLLYITETCS